MSLVWSSLTKIISIRYNKWCHSFVLICTIPKYPVVTYPRLQSSCCEDFQIKSDCLCKNNTAHVLHPWQALVVIWPASRKWLLYLKLTPLPRNEISDSPSAAFHQEIKWPAECVTEKQERSVCWRSLQTTSIHCYRFYKNLVMFIKI